MKQSISKNHKYLTPSSSDQCCTFASLREILLLLPENVSLNFITENGNSVTGIVLI